MFSARFTIKKLPKGSWKLCDFSTPDDEFVQATGSSTCTSSSCVGWRCVRLFCLLLMLDSSSRLLNVTSNSLPPTRDFSALLTSLVNHRLKSKYPYNRLILKLIFSRFSVVSSSNCLQLGFFWNSKQVLFSVGLDCLVSVFSIVLVFVRTWFCS